MSWDFLITDAVLDDIIQTYCNDFTMMARAKRYDPITGRDTEIDDLILILLQRGRKNAVLLGPAGVGKTALVVGLAQTIVSSKVPDLLKSARVLEIDMARMAAGTSSPAEFQARLIPLVTGIAERHRDPAYLRTILFVDEMHQIMPTCMGSAYRGLSDVMKPYLTVGDLMVIGATTLDEYREYVAADPALDRRFQKVTLSVPSVVETYRILQAVRGGYEKHHGITVPNVLLLLVTHLTQDHMRKRNQPDKSIITLDAAMAHHVKLRGCGGDLERESIYHMIARETGLNAAALHDPKRVETLIAQARDMG